MRGKKLQPCAPSALDARYGRGDHGQMRRFRIFLVPLFGLALCVTAANARMCDKGECVELVQNNPDDNDISFDWDFAKVAFPAFECAVLAGEAKLEVAEIERLFVYGAAKIKVPFSDLKPRGNVDSEMLRIMSSREYWIGVLHGDARSSVIDRLRENMTWQDALSSEAWRQRWRSHAQSRFNERNCHLIGR